MRCTTREARLAAALVEASDTLTEGFETTDYLQRVSDHCVELLSARAAGFMLIDSGRTVSLAGCSGQRELALELLRAQSGGGPCLDSYGTGRAVPPVSISVAHAGARWPGFTEQALRHGVAATFAVPVRRRETLLGALNVFTPTLPEGRTPEGDGELRLAQALADAAAVGLQNHRAYTRYRTLADQLQAALSSRVRIEQAKGMLAERWQTGADHAFTALRQYARRRRLPLDRVAQSVIDRVADNAELRREAEGGPGVQQ
ncbi:response regulator receiver and ANTAR domain-containing protein [Streptomyces davaonensis JCM 4913]|uniref:Response regulator receiver and ANTAR domain-containing protein n=1 Tax=Streptomyces davaonensis (strain DSM 101723 / JCM 4913 / KCC S-0913 / 768) TaxID=1214101 RepID=K4R0N3_STRDJ|nr:GAF and ANTAR domain-containing protein [Streptomyces davaonensis]CCK29811.1 response regulator receiver and ANTAR domain-containing protein [Streptomyces davaonensis JCM 4913]